MTHATHATPNALAFLTTNHRVSTHGSKYDDPWRQAESHERETERRRVRRLASTVSIDPDLPRAVRTHAIDTILIDECKPSEKEPTNA